MRKWYVLLVILAICFIGLATLFFNNSYKLSTHGSRSVLPNGGYLVWTQCWFDVPSNTSIECAKFHTAPQEKGGDSDYVLPVVVLHYTGLDRKKDPVLYMAGGPGSSAGLDKDRIVNYWIKWFRLIDFKRDLVLFDQRGTGLSEPNLSCSPYNKVIKESLFETLAPESKVSIFRTAMNDCYEKMKKEGVPVDQLSTLNSAADVRDLMDALHYEKWNLFGVSYSTRLAMVIENQYPERVRTLLLDSVYPISQHFFRDWPMLLDSSLQRLFAFCKSDYQCRSDYSDLESLFWETMASLRKKPFHVELPNKVLEKINKKETLSVLFDDVRFIDFLFDSQYESGGLRQLPDVIAAFNQRDISYVAYLQDYIGDFILSRLEDSVSEVVFRAVECRDNPILTHKDKLEAYQKFPKLVPYLSTEYDACDHWKDDSTVELNKVAKSDVPVLLLAGEDDPVTPIDWAEEVWRNYPNAEMFSFANVSHSVMDGKDCVVELYSKFLEDPTKRPSADCRESKSNGLASY